MAAPMLTGYRPSHDFRLPGELNDATHEYPDGRGAPSSKASRMLLQQTSWSVASLALAPAAEGRYAIGPGPTP
jgi:hypothetical protein